MIVKDYYKTLQIKPGADRNTIKKAFRKLAMEYHPDKQKDTRENQLYFIEIQEAYETLYDPQKREAYHYQRWLEGAMGHALDNTLTAEQIFQLFIKVERYIASMDQFRIDKNTLAHQLLGLFSATRLQTILLHDDESIRKEVAKLAMKLTSRLNSHGCRQLIDRFDHLLSLEPDLKSTWENIYTAMIKHEKYARIKVPLLILITIMLCIIYLLIRKQ